MRAIHENSVAVLVPDGVGVRNFILGRFLNELAATFRPHVFHYIPDQLLPQYSGRTDDSVEWYPMAPYLQHRAAMVLQYTLGYGHMYWANTNAMKRALGRRVKGGLKSKLLIHSTRLMGRVGAALNCMNAIEKAHCRVVEPRPEVGHYRKLFQRIQPRVLFCSHQRPTTVLPAVLAAKSLGIPTATFIFSWDNLSSKGRIAAPFDHYLVWSDHMRRELMHFYPHVPPENVHVVGTPQFDPYVDRSLIWSREEFCRRMGVDPSRKLICYSGGDSGTCPEDPQHVELLMSQVRSGLINGNPQVLLRPVPVDNGRRYDGVCSRYPELKRLQPQWVHTEPGNWAKVVPLAEDVQFLANLTEHSDLNINLGSTMTLDFGMHDKPVVNVAFDMSEPPVFGMPVYDYYYTYEHFQPVLEFRATRVARSPEQLAEFVNAYLENPALDREGRRRLVELEIDVPLGESSRRIVSVLENLASTHKEAPVHVGC